MRHSFLLTLVLFLAFLTTIYSYSYPVGGNNSNNVKMMTISGKVVEQDSDVPINTTVVIEVAGFNSIEVPTDKNGNFTTSIPSTEEFKIMVDAPGFEVQNNTIHYSVDEDGISDNIEIKLTPFVKLTLDGHILNVENSNPVEVQYAIYKFSDFLIEDSQTISDGKFTQKITDFGWYMIDLSAPGYLDMTDTVWVLNCKRKVIHKNYYLTPIEKGLTMQLNAIHFNFGKATFSQDSYPELDQTVKFLSRNPNLKVEVAGHTDSEGPDDYNLFLSQIRAEAIVNYLTKKGIKEDQLIAKGYGEIKPIDSNETTEGRARNRRVELVVLNE